MRGVIDRIGQGTSAPSRDDAESIAQHLRDILNTIQGSAAATPELGLPSLSDLLHEFPNAQPIIQQALREMVARFEPRLRSISVQPLPSESTHELTFTISARLADRAGGPPLRFQTRISRSSVTVE